MARLGKDKALFEELPLNSPDQTDPRTAVLRSIIPDAQGLSTTVYLDGTVEYSKAPSVAAQ
jgi:hypothetical protein